MPQRAHAIEACAEGGLTELRLKGSASYRRANLGFSTGAAMFQNPVSRRQYTIKMLALLCAICSGCALHSGQAGDAGEQCNGSCSTDTYYHSLEGMYGQADARKVVVRVIDQLEAFDSKFCGNDDGLGRTGGQSIYESEVLQFEKCHPECRGWVGD